ncbi:MAG: SpaH/EbpB family LPXTG-anchored major pilin, partial [Clostridia bacterium]|nr:SpaH/EbpB family LPXTG-anchored major pilin [Clostridia bacterium]
MINTQKLSQPGEGAWASIPVYCADAVTDGVPGHQYRRVNLEDSDFFSKEAAGRLRSIFFHSFPYIRDMEELEAAGNGWIKDSGKELGEIKHLRESEVISATQAAIWTLTNDVQVYEPYLGTGGYYRESEMVDTAIFRQEATEHTGDNIRSFYHYLLALEPTTAGNTVVSDASFGNVGVTFSKDGDTHSARITAEVTAQVDAEDQLLLRAVAGDCVSEAISVGNGSSGYELTLTGLKSDGDMITLHLEGIQNASDVFLFEPLDGRGKSQTMLGFDSSSLPVHGRITIDPTDRVLNIYKTDGNGAPLKNIGFQIYSAGSLNAYLKGELSIGQTPTQEEIDTYGTGQPLATLVTDENGVASWNFGAVDGIYLVMELPNPVIEKPVDPFYVAVPGRNEDQTIYAVNVYPKNNVIPEELRIRKDVLKIDCDQGSVDVGEIHTWIIRSDIPAGLGQGQKYEISDELDHRLSYMGNVVVSLAEKDAAAGENLKVLQPEVDYTLAVSKSDATVDGVLLGRDVFYVALTREGMGKAAAVTARDPEIRICFDTVINSYARVAEQIPNGATVEYVNSVGTRYRATSDEPWVCTGGLKVRKTDASDITKNLAGATFKLARLATEAEIEVGLSESRYVDGQVTELVFLPFFDNESMEDDQVTEVTTGEDGIALFYGLAYG